MDKRLRLTGIAALTGAALAFAALPDTALGLSDADRAATHLQIAGRTLSGGEPLPLAAAGSYALANPAPLEDRKGYDSSYLFAMTRGVADSTLVTALKPPLFVLTIPLDIALLPFAAIAGFF